MAKYFSLPLKNKASTIHLYLSVKKKANKFCLITGIWIKSMSNQWQQKLCTAVALLSTVGCAWQRLFVCLFSLICQWKEQWLSVRNRIYSRRACDTISLALSRLQSANTHQTNAATKKKLSKQPQIKTFIINKYNWCLKVTLILYNQPII